MHRVDDIFAYLAGRPASCSMCGSVLVAIAGNGLAVQTCPSCDATPGARPPADNERVPHGRLHWSEIPGCAECIQARRARI